MNLDLIVGEYSWASLMQRKHEKAEYRITLRTPTGKTVIRTFTKLREYNMWLDTYLERQNYYHDVTIVKTELVYK